MRGQGSGDRGGNDVIGPFPPRPFQLVPVGGPGRVPIDGSERYISVFPSPVMIVQPRWFHDYDSVEEIRGKEGRRGRKE